MRMRPNKRSSRIVEDAIPIPLEEDLVFEPNHLPKEHERIWHYHTKLVFKDGDFFVRVPFTSYLGPH